MAVDDDIREGGLHRVTWLRYYFAEKELCTYAQEVVLDVGYETGRVIANGELLKMALATDVSDLSSETLRRFRRMDLALEISEDSGDLRYFAVEIAFRAEQSGIDRALANARLLARFTGCPAHAVIAVGRDCPNLPEEILNYQYPVLLDSAGGEQVYLHQLHERNLERAEADLRYQREHYGS